MHPVARRPQRTEQTRHTQRQRVAVIYRIALVITPQGEHHIRHHHHQRSALGQLLIQAEQHTQRRDRDQPATDPEQAAERTECSTEQEIQQPACNVHVPSGV